MRLIILKNSFIISLYDGEDKNRLIEFLKGYYEFDEYNLDNGVIDFYIRVKLSYDFLYEFVNNFIFTIS